MKTLKKSDLFFRRDALKEQFGKEPSTVRCLAVKSALLGTRHPRKEKEAALQNITGEPACQYGQIRMTTQSTEMEPSIKIEELKRIIWYQLLLKIDVCSIAMQFYAILI